MLTKTQVQTNTTNNHRPRYTDLIRFIDGTLCTDKYPRDTGVAVPG